jgi:hypothetical protein
MATCGRLLAREFSLLWEEEERRCRRKDAYLWQTLSQGVFLAMGGGRREGAGWRMTNCGRFLAKRNFPCSGRRRKRRSRGKDGYLWQNVSQGVFLDVGGGGREGAGGRMATCGRMLAREFFLLWEEEEEKEQEEGWLKVADS